MRRWIQLNGSIAVADAAYDIGPVTYMNLKVFVIAVMVQVDAAHKLDLWFIDTDVDANNQLRPLTMKPCSSVSTLQPH